MINSNYYSNHKTGAIPLHKEVASPSTKYCVGQENRVYKMKIYLVIKYIFVDNISREIVKFEDYWEEVK